MFRLISVFTFIIFFTSCDPGRGHLTNAENSYYYDILNKNLVGWKPERFGQPRRYSIVTPDDKSAYVTVYLYDGQKENYSAVFYYNYGNLSRETYFSGTDKREYSYINDSVTVFKSYENSKNSPFLKLKRTYQSSETYRLETFNKDGIRMILEEKEGKLVDYLQNYENNLPHVKVELINGKGWGFVFNKINQLEYSIFIEDYKFQFINHYKSDKLFIVDKGEFENNSHFIDIYGIPKLVCGYRCFYNNDVLIDSILVDKVINKSIELKSDIQIR